MTLLIPNRSMEGAENEGTIFLEAIFIFTDPNLKSLERVKYSPNFSSAFVPVEALKLKSTVTFSNSSYLFQFNTSSDRFATTSKPPSL